MVLITPRLVRPLDPDEVPPLPTSRRRSCRRRSKDARPSERAGGGGRPPMRQRGAVEGKQQPPRARRTVEKTMNLCHDQRLHDCESAAPCSSRWPWRCSALLAFSAFVVDYGVMWVAAARPERGRRRRARRRDLAGLRRARPISPARRTTKVTERVGAREQRVGRSAGRAAADVTLPAGSPGSARAAGHVRRRSTRIATARPRQPAADVLRPAGRRHEHRACGRPRRRRSSPATATDCLKPWAVIDRVGGQRRSDPATHDSSPTTRSTARRGWTPNDVFQPLATDLHPAVRGNTNTPAGPSRTTTAGSHAQERRRPRADRAGLVPPKSISPNSGPDGTTTAGTSTTVHPTPVGIADDQIGDARPSDVIGCMSVKTGAQTARPLQGIAAPSSARTPPRIWDRTQTDRTARQARRQRRRS